MPSAQRHRVTTRRSLPLPTDCRSIADATAAAAADPADRIDYPACRCMSLAADPALRGRSQGGEPAHDVPDRCRERYRPEPA